MPFKSSFATPHDDAIALLKGKPAFARDAFDKLLPELKARAITVSGIESLKTIERVRDEIATLPAGEDWDTAKGRIVDLLAEDLGDGAERRAELLLRTHGFQAYQAATWETGMADPDTTHWQYLATEDDHVRDSHLALNGITLPKDDPFWEDHFPPWDWGCRCRVRPMNPDLVDVERAADEARPPEGRNVVDGAVARRLRDGQVTRAIPADITDPTGPQKLAQSYDVTPGQGKGAFRAAPGSLRLPLHDILQRYTGQEQDDFLSFARKTQIAPHATVMDWLEGKALPRDHESLAGIQGSARDSGLADARQWPARVVEAAVSPAEGMARLTHDRTIRSQSGIDVTIGQVTGGHFRKSGTELRGRFLPRVESVLKDPEEVWDGPKHRYYLGRIGGQGFVVVAVRQGERADLVVNYFPKDLDEMWKLREGRLVYQR